MNKFPLYILLILVFLGLSKSFSPAEQETIYIENERVFAGIFQGAPISLILIDNYAKGLLIKTYYQRYLVIHAFRPAESITVRVSRPFWKENLNNLGLALFWRRESDMSTNTVPTPPGMLFIGDPAFGSWESSNKSGDKNKRFWNFYYPYRHFPSVFGWGDFVPSDEIYKQMLAHLNQEIPFYGPKGLFGPEGKITKNLVKEYHGNYKPKEKKIWEHLKKYFFIPQFNKKSRP